MHNKKYKETYRELNFNNSIFQQYQNILKISSGTISLIVPTLSKDYISKDDKVLIIDDFLANGEAALGAVRLVEEAGAKVSGIGIVIEKSFQPGRSKLEEKGYEVYSLARVKKLGKNLIEFID